MALPLLLLLLLLGKLLERSSPCPADGPSSGGGGAAIAAESGKVWQRPGHLALAKPRAKVFLAASPAAAAAALATAVVEDGEGTHATSAIASAALVR